MKKLIGRPCQRCIKRSIGHLCHDEIKTPPPNKNNGPASSSPTAPVKKSSISQGNSIIDISSSSIPVVPQHLVGKSYTIF
jgi:hypothetical protein